MSSLRNSHLKDINHPDPQIHARDPRGDLLAAGPEVPLVHPGPARPSIRRLGRASRPPAPRSRLRLHRLPITWTLQMAQVSHSTSQLHMATAFHFLRENILSPPDLGPALPECEERTQGPRRPPWRRRRTATRTLGAEAYYIFFNRSAKIKPGASSMLGRHSTH